MEIDCTLYLVNILLCLFVEVHLYGTKNNPAEGIAVLAVIPILHILAFILAVYAIGTKILPEIRIPLPSIFRKGQS